MMSCTNSFVVLCANIHQGSDIFSMSSRGNQCLPNCLVFLTLSKIEDVNLWSSVNLDRIMCSGDDLYNSLRQTGHILPTDLPPYFKFKNKYYSLSLKNVCSGMMVNFVDDYPFLSLESCVGLFLSEIHGDMIFVVLGYGMALKKIGNKICFFDSHSRNENGLCVENGTCILSSFVNQVQTICNYIRSLVRSLTSTELSSVEFNCQFLVITEIKYNTFRRKTNSLSINSYDSIHSFQNRTNNNGVDQVVNKPYKQNHRKRKYGISTEKSYSLSQRNFGRNDSEEKKNDDTSKKSKKYKITKTTGKDGLENTPQNLSTCKEQHSLDSIITTFKKAVCCGPEYLCCCCLQTWFRHGVCHVSSTTLGNINETYITNTTSFCGKRWLCHTCYQSLKQGKIPALSLFNGLSFPNRPKELELTQLEERLVAPRIPFMQIYEKARGGQYAVKGNVVNVPVNVSKTIKILPRTFSDSETIPVKLKRKQSYKHHVSYESVRPNRVIDAAKYLVATSEIFKNEGITVNESWLENYEYHFSTESKQGDQPEEKIGVTPHTSINVSNDDHQNREDSPSSKTVDNDEWSEVDMSENIEGNLDTLMHPADFREFNQILSLAPGEGNTPLSLYEDKNAEFLAFPTVYAGKTREDNNKRKVPLHYSQIVKWELRNVDRRVATNIPLLFFKMKKIQIKLIRDKVTLAVRKFQTKGEKLTAGQILEPGGIDRLVKLDEGYRVLRTIRASPPYWEQAKRDVFAMIRQLGLPNLFCSFSAAETKWTPLLQTLSKLAKQKELTVDEVNNLTWQDKCSLIKSDPVTCVRYFDFKVQKFINMVLKNSSNPVGQIVDFFYRVEFQQRGSPHIHMILWVSNLPHFSSESENHQHIIEFIDQYITCSKDGARSDLVNYQTHRHAKTCRKKGKAVCRFDFPLPPMPKTMILSPLNANDIGFKQAKLNLETIKTSLNSLKLGDESSFDEFLTHLGFDFNTYIMALRSDLRTTKVFLRRSLAEIRINSYNKVLLESWEANMDIQYVIDAYSCVSYIVSYISKGQRGMSNLLSDACREAHDISSSIRQQVRIIGNKFLTHVEVGAQEAVYLLLQMPLRKSSRAVKFINTSPSDERTVLLKSIDILERMAKKSTDIECDNIIKQYVRRPKILQSLCLADYVAWYDLKYDKGTSGGDAVASSDCLDYENPETDDAIIMSDVVLEDILGHETEDNQLQAQESLHDDCLNPSPFPKQVELKNGSTLIRRRFKKVIRYVRYNVEIDRENHFREKLMLFFPWKNEKYDLLGGCSTFEEHYCKVQSIIEPKQAMYETVAHLKEVDESLSNDDIEFESVTPSCSHEDGNELEQNNMSLRYGCFNPNDPSLHESYDLGLDLGISRTNVGVNVISDTILPDNIYRENIRMLNEEQKRFFYHTLHWFKVNHDEPLYTFLSGGAGVGKSVVTRSLYQALHRYFCHQAGSCPDDIKILLCAPTGKAAHNIGGNTIHSTFHIPANQNFCYKPLDMQQLNSLRCKYAALKVVLIDEISMVGNKMFNFINLRLQELKGSSKIFGGVSIIAIGDLFQLKPIYDGWIFSNIRSDYGPLASNLWVDNFQMYELQTIMRQKDDRLFAEILNRLREGNHTANDLKLIKERLVNEAVLFRNLKYESLPHLYTTRAQVFKHNNKIYEHTENAKCEILAVDTLCGDISYDLSQKILSKISLDSSKTMGLEGKLCLAENIPAEICLNIDVEDGLTNGASCVIRKIDYRVNGSDRCSIVWVEFSNLTVGKKCRMQYKHLFKSYITSHWVLILEVTRQFSIQYYKSYQIVRRQFPVHLAAAKTIHKSQGSTMSKAVIDFGERKTDHIHYVGLSRVQNLSQINILNLNEEKIATSTAVHEEMERLRNNEMKLCLPNLQVNREKNICNSLIVAFHNTRSLYLHIEDLRHEYNLTKVDILVLSETRLTTNDQENDYNLEGFSTIRFDYKVKDLSRRPPYGMVMYLRHNIWGQPHEYSYRLLFGIEVVSLILDTCGKTVHCFFVYCPPPLATKDKLIALFFLLSHQSKSGSEVFILGDFNVDSMLETYLCDFAKEVGFSQLISNCTTDYGSSLDHIYTNVNKNNIKMFGTLENYYSDHKPIFFKVV